MAVEHLDPSFDAGSVNCNDWTPGAWTNAPAISDEEYQPDIEPPHINDYSAFKKHKHYRQYFRPYRYVPFPAFMYGPNGVEKIVKSKEEVIALGPEWSPTPPQTRLAKIDMTGKSLPVKTDTQRLTEALVAGLAQKPLTSAANGMIDPSVIAAIVSATVAALQQNIPIPPKTTEEVPMDKGIERKALLELAQTKSVEIDKRWSNERIKEALGLTESTLGLD